MAKNAFYTGVLFCLAIIAYGALGATEGTGAGDGPLRDLFRAGTVIIAVGAPFLFITTALAQMRGEGSAYSEDERRGRARR